MLAVGAWLGRPARWLHTGEALQGGSINPLLIRADRIPRVSDSLAVVHRTLVEEWVGEAGWLGGGGRARSKSCGYWPRLVVCRGIYGGLRRAPTSPSLPGHWLRPAGLQERSNWAHVVAAGRVPADRR
ncbi:hypothetical protein NDU88_005845 [Pleurodeles waltl]|uniref:Uncharacterized protein n=1 Tax=Pleurodeles waltl TaxID=8319 RepID=A0AAV7WD03_PLEWA|nr:hypothetical protein NDU88_005845 [Pleurodeles waltl]